MIPFKKIIVEDFADIIVFVFSAFLYPFEYDNLVLMLLLLVIIFITYIIIIILKMLGVNVMDTIMNYFKKKKS